jgi:predicted component of type VI protein secretion system
MRQNSLAKAVVCTALLTAVLVSCKKNSEDQPKPDLPAQTKQIEVNLNTGYMPAAKVDSALAIWEVGTYTQTIRLSKDGEKLTGKLAEITREGTGTLTVQLFTQTKIGQIPLQWEKQLPYTLSRTAPVSFTAPTAINDKSWNPRAICESTMHMASFTAIIALRPQDAYFELKGVEPAISKRIEVVRSFFTNDTATLVASRGWIGKTNDLDAGGNLIDRHHFRSLPEQLENRQWQKMKVRASFYANLNPHQIIEAEFVHDPL